MYNFAMILGELETLLGMSVTTYLLSILPNLLLSVASYVLTGLGLYTIARRRGIHNPWLAWVPVGNMWLIGCISDHYRSVARGQVKNRRKALLILNIAMGVLSVVIVVLLGVLLGSFLAVGLEQWGTADPAAVLAAVAGPAIGMLVAYLLLMGLTIAHLVFYLMSMHDIYLSCEPNSATMYLVLGIFIQICNPVFLMLCRHKDDGLPRKVAQPVPKEG